MSDPKDMSDLDEDEAQAAQATEASEAGDGDSDAAVENIDNPDNPLEEPPPPPPPQTETKSPLVEPVTPPPPPPTRRRAKRDGNSWWELLKTVVYAVLIAVVVRTIFFQPFNIPSASMENTLLIGDYLFVSKYSYGYSLYSLPWGYWVREETGLEGRIFGSEPERGDIVVFKFPPDNKTDYIKRVIGLPGDRIQMIDGLLHINGKQVPRTFVADDTATGRNGRPIPVKRFHETLPNGVSYDTLDMGTEEYNDNTGVFTVPPGHYFMMGDNRDNSDDSRGAVGYVPYENLIGHAQFIWWSYDDTMRLFQPWTWPGAIRYDRIATFVD